MTLDIKIPDIDALKALDDAGFATIVCASLSRYNMQAPCFNLAAKAQLTTLGAMNRAMTIYPGEAQSLVFACIKALHEYDRTGKISNHAREEFIVTEVKDLLRTADTDQTTLAYKVACDDVMNYVSSRMTGIGSLALAPAANDYKAPKPKGPKKPS